MYEQKYVIYRLDRDGNEQYWNGRVTGKKLNTTCRTDEAKVFDTAQEAYLTVGVLVGLDYLPQTWLDSRVGKRMIADETVVELGHVTRKSVPGYKVATT